VLLAGAVLGPASGAGALPESPEASAIVVAAAKVRPRPKVTLRKIANLTVAAGRKAKIRPRYEASPTARVVSAKVTVRRAGVLLAKNRASFKARPGKYKVTQTVTYRKATRTKPGKKPGKVKVVRWSARTFTVKKTQRVVVRKVRAPKNLERPAVSGVVQPGMTLTATKGKWRGKVTRFTYTWLVDGVPVGTTGLRPRSYIPRFEDLGKKITVHVTARNAAGANLATSPARVVVPARAALEPCPGSTFVEFDAGSNFAVARTASGVVCTWGDGSSGQLGTTTAGYAGEPLVARVPSASQVAAGSRHVLALTSTGEVYAWGANDLGQLGIVDQAIVRSPQEATWAMRGVPMMFAPQRVPGLPAISSVVALADLSLAVARDGTVYRWGFDGEGGIISPTRIPGVRDVARVVTDGDGFLALTRDGRLLQWGVWEIGYWTDDGTLTDRGGGWVATESIAPEKARRLLSSSVVRDLAMGLGVGYVLDEAGSVFAVGHLPYAIDPAIRTLRSPERLAGLPAVTSIDAGGTSAVAGLADGGTAYWGEDGGELAHMTTTPLGDRGFVRITAPQVDPQRVGFGGSWLGALDTAGRYRHLLSEGLNTYDGYPFRTAAHPGEPTGIASIDILSSAKNGCEYGYEVGVDAGEAVVLTTTLRSSEPETESVYTDVYPYSTVETHWGGLGYPTCSGKLRVGLTMRTTSIWTWAPDGKVWTASASKAWR